MCAKKIAPSYYGAILNNPGSDLLSHGLSTIVSSALEGLTSVFGMRTGVAPPVLPPGNSLNQTYPIYQRQILNGQASRSISTD